jgi:hypothetical protein
MDRDYIIEKLQSGEPTKEKLLGWLRAMPSTSAKKRPVEYKVGDVFMHSIFHHPYVLMEKKGDMWICGLLTSEPSCAEILCETRSRFFTENYFTRSLFTVAVPTGSFYGVYDNKRHLTSVLKRLKKMFV